jgi:hypothetical protein
VKKINGAQKLPFAKTFLGGSLSFAPPRFVKEALQFISEVLLFIREPPDVPISAETASLFLESGKVWSARDDAKCFSDELKSYFFQLKSRKFCPTATFCGYKFG